MIVCREIDSSKAGRYDSQRVIPSLNLSEKEKKMANDNHLSLRYML